MLHKLQLELRLLDSLLQSLPEMSCELKMSRLSVQFDMQRREQVVSEVT